jgi:hypothetical protein
MVLVALNPNYALGFVMRKMNTKKVEMHGKFIPQR